MSSLEDLQAFLNKARDKQQQIEGLEAQTERASGKLTQPQQSLENLYAVDRMSGGTTPDGQVIDRTTLEDDRAADRWGGSETRYMRTIRRQQQEGQTTPEGKRMYGRPDDDPFFARQTPIISETSRQATDKHWITKPPRVLGQRGDESHLEHLSGRANRPTSGSKTEAVDRPIWAMEKAVGDRPERSVTRDRKSRSDRLTAKAPDLNDGVKLPKQPLTAKPVHREARPKKNAAVGPPILDLEKQSDEEMIEANIKAVEEAREAGKSPLTPNQQKIVRRMREERPKTEEIPLMEKDAGGGAGGMGGLAGGGTVAVASDPGVFTSTYGGDAKRRLGMRPGKKKRKKKKDKYRTSGVTKLDRFLRGEKVNQTKKSVSVQEFATWVVEDALVNKKLDATKRRPGVAGVPENYVDDPPTGKGRSGPDRNPWGRGGKLKPAKGQQFLTDFKKMNLIATVLEKEGSVMSLMKAIDIDTSVDVD